MLLTPKIADHSFIRVKVVDQNINLKNKIKVKCYKNYSKEKLNMKLNEVDWLDFYNKFFDEKCEYLIDNLESCMQLLISYKYINEGKEDSSWFNNDLKQMKIWKEESYIRAALSNEEHHWTEYIRIKNEYVIKLNSAKNNSVINKLDKCGNNQKLLWKTLKSELIPSKSVRPKSTGYIEFNGVKETDVNVIVNSFNNYFIDSIVDINNSIEVFDIPARQNISPAYKFKFKTVLFSNLKNIVDSVQGNSDNNISSKVLVDSFDMIGEFFLSIINTSLHFGQFPKTWKQSVIMPIQKKPRTKKAEEFRGINTLPVYEKVLENVVKNQLLEYIEHHKLLIAEQSGFRKGHSCESALNFVICEWKQYDF